MKIITACVANHAEALGAGLYLQGAFPQFFHVPSVPCFFQIHFAFVAEFEPDELGEAFPVLIETRRAGHETTAWQELTLSRRAAESDFDGFPLYGHYIEHPEAHFSDEGAYEVEILSMDDRKQLAIARYGIRLSPSGLTVTSSSEIQRGEPGGGSGYPPPVSRPSVERS